MPPTRPCGIPAVGIEPAALLAFILPFNDGQTMTDGITAKSRSPPLNHSITFFDRVRLPASALLSPLRVRLENRTALWAHHINTIWEIAVGALALGGSCITALDRSAYIAARYSQRRIVGLPDKSRYGLIPATLSQAFVAKKFFQVAVKQFSDTATDLWQARTTTLLLSERCGAQGQFAYNQICSLHASLLGLSIAEGDTLGLCIRLVSELLQERYHVPGSTHPTSLLARHETGLLNENRATLEKMSGHRSAEFNNLVLPQSERIVRAIGHRMAYDSAVDAELDPKIAALYLATVVKTDSAWHSEKVEFGRDLQDDLENEAVCVALPYLNEWLVQTGAKHYSQVPIISETEWAAFVEDLQEFYSESLAC
ncbi:hypothetical protein DFH09DRAFT_1253366 [Mycena vulgaris]|nr:hypothetical protein DFH09DRAFT_1253366 [Mycena vulgaris]